MCGEAGCLGEGGRDDLLPPIRGLAPTGELGALCGLGAGSNVSDRGDMVLSSNSKLYPLEDRSLSVTGDDSWVVILGGLFLRFIDDMLGLVGDDMLSPLEVGEGIMGDSSAALKGDEAGCRRISGVVASLLSDGDDRYGRPGDE